jgi:hypothetical protein
MKVGDRVYLIAKHLGLGLGAVAEITGLRDPTKEVVVRTSSREAALHVKRSDVLPARLYTLAVLCAVYNAVWDLERELGSIAYIEPQGMAAKLIDHNLSPQIALECINLFDLVEWRRARLPLCQWLRRVKDFYYQRPSEPPAT